MVSSPLYSGARVRVRGGLASCAISPSGPSPLPSPPSTGEREWVFLETEDCMNRRNWLRSLFALSLALVAPRASFAADDAKGFSLQDVPNDHLDILLDGKVVARYMDG